MHGILRYWTAVAGSGAAATCTLIRLFLPAPSMTSRLMSKAQLPGLGDIEPLCSFRLAGNPAMIGAKSPEGKARVPFSCHKFRLLFYVGLVEVVVRFSGRGVESDSLLDRFGYLRGVRQSVL